MKHLQGTLGIQVMRFKSGNVQLSSMVTIYWNYSEISFNLTCLKPEPLSEIFGELDCFCNITIFIWLGWVRCGICRTTRQWDNYQHVEPYYIHYVHHATVKLGTEHFTSILPPLFQCDPEFTSGLVFLCVGLWMGNHAFW